MIISYSRPALVLWLLLLLNCTVSMAQQIVNGGPRCATMEVMNNAFKRNPALKASFDKQSARMLQTVAQRKARGQNSRILGATIYIPVVFHIVLQNPALVSDAQLQAQIDQLNTDFAGLNPDTNRIPAAFKPLFAKTQIQFKLAQRTPDNEPATGIERTVTTRNKFSIDDPALKYAVQGGANAWDRDRFLNVWITDLADNYLGYSTFPGSPAAEDGIAINYNSLPGSAGVYNKGRTLVHESGHYFFLFHIWGDENFCGADDGIDDTPKQATHTTGCPVGEVRIDQCTNTAPGIMYQNYMDYTDDACMVMFTNDQVLRMETALSTYRASLFTTNGGDPVVLPNLDAAVKSINSPVALVCTPDFAPVITLRNRGTQTITSATITAVIDGGTAAVTQWTGSLPSLGEVPVTLNTVTTTTGAHVLTVTVTQPNGSMDDNAGNNTFTVTYQYQAPVTPPLTESFEQNIFPPAGWSIINPDQSYTWERVTNVGRAPGKASVMMRNFEYMLNGQQDFLRLPLINITNADSAFLTFYVAAAVISNLDAANNPFDTLQVLASNDCGISHTSLYKKGGSSLITRTTPAGVSYVPAANEWRKDSVNLTPYINKGPVLLSFLNTTQYENNIYLDDINVYSVSINPNVKAKGFLVSPNPTSGKIAVQFFPNPGHLKGINIFNAQGSRIVTRPVNGPGSSTYEFDLTGYASGVYIVQVVLDNQVLTQKVFKL
jgi:hypothetical protein